MKHSARLHRMQESIWALGKTQKAIDNLHSAVDSNARAIANEIGQLSDKERKQAEYWINHFAGKEAMRLVKAYAKEAQG